MTAVADKARYFLEQSVPELKEYERKKIFSADEITSIAKRRSDFEHKVNARGSSPSDYVQYAEFEINVEALRKRRVKRLGIKSTAHNGQRRIFFVFDRGTRKFPGDVNLWMQNAEYVRQQKAYKKLTQTLTNALRLHPTKVELWIYAAACAIEDRGDMNEARSYMQRAIRFTKSSWTIWIEYARLELAYIAKIHARRQILGIDRDHDNTTAEDDEDENMIRLPRLTANDVAPESNNDHEINETTLRKLDKTPVMSGAIPLAIFDAAMTQFQHSVSFAHRFFEMLSTFGEIFAARRLLAHVLAEMENSSATSWHTCACNTAMPIFGIPSASPEYPAALRQSLKVITKSSSQCADKTAYTSWCKSWLEATLQADLDPALDAIIRSKLVSLGSSP